MYMSMTYSSPRQHANLHLHVRQLIASVVIRDGNMMQLLHTRGRNTKQANMETATKTCDQPISKEVSSPHNSLLVHRQAGHIVLSNDVGSADGVSVRESN